MNTRFQTIQLLILSSLMSTAAAQKVSIPDPVLNGAIRRALQELQRPLTVQDMLSLTNLNAHNHCLGDCEFPSSLTVIDPGARGSPSRFYRALER